LTISFDSTHLAKVEVTARTTMYIPLDTVTSLYLAACQAQKTCVVERLVNFRGSLHYLGCTKLTTGAADFVDTYLATHTLGFVKPHLLGIIGHPSHSELGYKVFHLAIHLYSKTTKFFPHSY
jgi:hypothetical protein